MSALSILSAKGGRLITISPSTCFTDAGTTNASVGDQVASVNSNGAYFTWETTKPTLRGTGGVYWLEFPVDSYLFSSTIGVTASSDHARGAILSSSNTSVWPRWWCTTNTSRGTNNSSISAIGYNQGKPFIFNGDDNVGNVVEAVHPSLIGSGIVGVSSLRRGNDTILRVNGVQSTVTTSALNGGYYPNRAVIGSPAAGCNIYAVWDCPVGLTNAEALEIENDLGLLAGASWASSGGVTGTLAATEGSDTFAATATFSGLNSFAATEGPDVASFTGTFVANVTGTFAATEGADTFAATGSFSSSSTGTITAGPLIDAQGNLRINETGVVVYVYNDSTGALVVKKMGLTTNGTGMCFITDALIVPATAYRTRIVLSDGTDDLPQDTAT